MDDIKIEELQETFKSIDEELGTQFVKEVSIEEIDKHLEEEFGSTIHKAELKNDANTLMENVRTEIADINQKKEEIESSLSNAHITDSNFLEKEIKSLILSSKSVLQTLENDIKIGAAPRMYEVYATLLNAITSQYKELRNLNESIAKFVIETKKHTLEETKEQHRVAMNSKDALDMYIQAKKDSQMDMVDTEFDIVPDDKD